MKHVFTLHQPFLAGLTLFSQLSILPSYSRTFTNNITLVICCSCRPFQPLTVNKMQGMIYRCQIILSVANETSYKSLEAGHLNLCTLKFSVNSKSSSENTFSTQYIMSIFVLMIHSVVIAWSLLWLFLLGTNRLKWLLNSYLVIQSSVFYIS